MTQRIRSTSRFARHWLHAALWCAAGCGANVAAHAQQPTSMLNPPPVFVSELPTESQRYDAAPAGFVAPPQTVDAIDVAQAPPGVPGAVPADVQLSQAELYDRLLKTEARLKELEKSGAPLTDPKSQTMTGAIVERWNKAQDPSITTVDQQTYSSSSKKASEKKWHDRLSIRGYAQFRLNEIVDREPGSAPAHYVGDRSIGEDQGFIIRRARIIISGDVSDHLYVYLQPDFASTPNGASDQIQFTQIRDWYGDVYLDQYKVNRLRLGQSKIPYGWENLQSSSNRVALDRSDSLNSAARNERDLGIFYYWTPEDAQDFFKDVLDMGLKGSGNYGVFGLGVYNGQGGSLAEQNDDLHVIARLTIPVRFDSGQMAEFGVQGYTGRYTVLSTAISPLGVGPSARPLNTLENGGRRGIQDERIATTFVYYPQPIGFQTEWNVGRSPALNAAQTAVEERALYGGYAQLFAKIDSPRLGTLFPYVRYTYYKGGMKAERNAPFTDVDEVEMGTEWQFTKQTELTLSYLIADRTNTTAIDAANRRSYGQFDGSVVRAQFQINY
jgi:hypothetical protein